MPCRSDDFKSAEDIANRKNKEKNALIEPYRKKLDHVTQLLCDMCRKVEKDAYGLSWEHLGTNIELSKWWIEHKKKDEEREQQENARIEMEALEKRMAELKKIIK